MNSLDCLDAMARLSTGMVEAARANDWAALAELEQRLAAERARLEVAEADGYQSSLAERQRKAELIQQILSDGEEVLRHVQPFQESLRRLLSTSNVGRSLRQAYAVGP
jgi:flagellar protein FliT